MRPADTDTRRLALRSSHMPGMGVRRRGLATIWTREGEIKGQFGVASVCARVCRVEAGGLIRQATRRSTAWKESHQARLWRLGFVPSDVWPLRVEPTRLSKGHRSLRRQGTNDAPFLALRYPLEVSVHIGTSIHAHASYSNNPAGSTYALSVQRPASVSRKFRY